MSNKFTGITSAGSAIPVYDKDAHSALSQKLDTTALAPAIEAAVSGKQDAGDYYSATNPSGFISSVPETYLQNSDLTVNEGKITEISGIPLSAGDELPEIVTQAADLVSANSATWDTVTGKQDAGDYYSASNPSGFIDANALTPYQTIEGMSAYQPSGDYQAAGDYYSASNPSGFISSVPDTYLQNTDLTVNDGKVTEISGIPLSAGDELPSGVMVESAVEYNAVNEISGYNGTAIAQYGAEKQWLVHDDTLVHASNSAQYALGVNLSAVAQLLGIDETVLWENTNNYFSATNSTGQFAYPLSAFEAIEFRCNVDNITEQRLRFSSPSFYTKNLTVSWQEFYQNYRLYYLTLSTDGNSFTGVSNCLLTTNGTVNQNLTVAQSNWQYGYIGLKKIVGIGRKQ